MTFEGYITLLISILGCIVFFRNENNYQFKKMKFIKSDLLQTAFFFVVNFVFVLCYSRIIVALVIINTFMWIFFMRFMKTIKYPVLFWFSSFIYWFYLLATHSNFENISIEEVWKLTLFVWFVFLLIVLIYESLGKFSRLLSAFFSFIIGFCVFTPPFVFILYNQIFNHKMNEAQLNAIYQSNLSEAYEFAFTYASNYQLAIIPIVLVALVTIFFFLSHSKTSNLKWATYSKVVIFLFAIAHINLLEGLALPSLLINSHKVYAQELDKFRTELEKRKVEGVSFSAKKEAGKELYVVVIGESLNKNHMSLYGYHRNTTPLLDSLYLRGDLIKYENTFSNHTHTIPVLTQSLTTANQLNGKDYYTSVSILDIIEEADIDTYWISNQVSYGEWDNPISVLADRADKRININKNIGKVTKTDFFDEYLVSELDNIVSNGIENNTVIFLHVIGNHGAYKNRYPEQFEIFSGKLPIAEFGENKYWDKNVNEYDNSVIYQDKIVSDILDILDSYSGISACLYFSDHSEDVLANKGHNSSSFTYSMIQTPLFAWFSKSYKLKYPKLYRNFISNKECLFSNDFIYDMLVDFIGVRTNHYDKKRSTMNLQYTLKENESFTLHGKKSYLNAKNNFYYQKKNIGILDSLHLKSKIYPHRVNTIGKLSEIMYSGFNSLEVDVIYKQQRDLSYFEVGHDNDALSGITLEEYLNEISTKTVEKIWLDIKNLNKDNLQQLEQRLVYLDSIFSLKERSIIETTSGLSSFSHLAKLGFHTSFYIPTNINDIDEYEYNDKAVQIAKQVFEQNVSAVSFDASLYPFVKTYLEPLISSKIVYHTWDIKLKLKEKDFWSRMTDEKFLSDSRVKSILVKYNSPFEL